MKIDYLYEQYKKDVYYYLYHLSQNTTATEDLTAEVFLSAIKSLPNFRGDSDIKTWLFGIARLKWFEFLRKEKKYRSTLDRLSLYINQVDILDERDIFNKEVSQKIMSLLGEQSEKAKEIVLLRVDGYSFCEIAKKVGISESSARVVDFRTKKKIREILTKEGYSYE